jgi:hypothetical protein
MLNWTSWGSKRRQSRSHSCMAPCLRRGYI